MFNNKIFRLKGLLFIIVCAFLHVSLSVLGQNAEKKLFTRVLSSESGIDFSNLIPENDFMNIISHPNHWNGGGVAIGDLNNDGLPEVYFTGNHVSDKLYLNKGNLRFDDITASAKLDVQEGWKTGVTLVDINQDGWLDIYVCKAGPNDFYPEKTENLLYINNGDLTFKESAAEYGVNDNGLSIQAVFFDMDNDGDQDLFVANNNHELSYGSNIYSKKVLPEGVNRLYRNNGNGRFEDVSTTAGILSENALTLNVVAADLNNDGLKDIYVSNDLVSSDHVYMNQGNGVFLEKGREMFKHYCSNAMGSDIADFNNDGLADVLVVDMFPENPERQKNQAGITNDYFESMVRQGHHPQYVRNTLSLNNGNGTFSDIAHMAGIAHTDWSWCPLFADFDNDGLKDILVTNSLKKNILDNDFRVYKMDSIMRFVTFNKKTALYKALNKTESLNLKNYIFKNKGDLRFEQAMEEWGLNDAINTTSAAYGDLDNDGDLDLVLNNLDTAAWVYRNNSNEISENGFLRFSTLPDAKIEVYSNGTVQTQEFVGSRGYQSYPESTLHFGIGSALKPDSIKAFRFGEYLGKSAEVAGNQELELENLRLTKEKESSALSENIEPLFEPDEELQYRHKENPYDDFKREPLLYERHSQQGPKACTGDVNNDGLLDLYTSGALGISGQLFLQQPDGSFEKSHQEAISTDAANEDGACVFFDVNNDGFLDLYVGSAGYELEEDSPLLADRLYINNGAGNLERNNTLLPEFRSNTTCLAAADYDKDGYTDLFVGGGAIPGKYPLSYSSRLLKNEAGKLVDVTKTSAPEFSELKIVKDAVWTDYDGDKNLDLMVVGHWMPITLFQPKGKKFRKTSIALINAMNGFWNTIVEFDKAGDSTPDYVVGNTGINTRLQANTEQPIRIHASDFDNNGALDAVLTYYVQGTETVIHTRDALLDQMIGLKKKYLFYKQYAKATLSDILSEESLASADVLEVNELRTVMFTGGNLNEPEIEYLPPECQISPVRSIVTSDFNKDGFEDLILAGNKSEPHFTYGKDQAGIGTTLLGGKNSLSLIEGSYSGLLLDDEVTDMEILQDSDNLRLVVFPKSSNAFIYKTKP